jgi:hypothetical protein
MTMVDFAAMLTEKLMEAGEEVIEEITEAVDSVNDVFGLDEFGTEGLW